MVTHEPIWCVLHECAQELTAQGHVPFTRLALLSQARNRIPNLQRSTFDQIVQSMTLDASGRSRSSGAGLLSRIERGQYILSVNRPDRTSGSSVETWAPAGWPRAQRSRPRFTLSERVAALKKSFPDYLDTYDEQVPFTRAGQLELHLRTISRRRQLGSVGAAVHDLRFRRDLRATLEAWGIGRRSSRLVDESTFTKALENVLGDLESLDGLQVSKLAQPEQTIDQLWRMVERLGVVTNDAKVVAGTKTLHHLLPDLVVPIDRAWTGAFFGWPPLYFQYQQSRIFLHANRTFAEVARMVQPASYVAEGWRSSESKLIDNAIVGYCKAHGIAPLGPSSKQFRLNPAEV